jgi:hypothetical protein
MLDDTRSGDRPAEELDKVEITPEMIEAGLAELYRHDITVPFRAEMMVAVKQVYRSMCSVRPGFSDEAPRRSSVSA